MSVIEVVLLEQTKDLMVLFHFYKRVYRFYRDEVLFYFYSDVKK